MADPGFVEAAAYRTQDEAREAAATLVASGVGATVHRVSGVDDESGIEVSAYQVVVLAEQRLRAQELLGIVEPRPVPEGDEERPAELEKLPVPWLRIFFLWLLAMLLIPTAAFFLTVWLGGR